MGLFEPTKKQLGEQSQAHIIARLLEVGYTVLTPYGDSSRYDLVIEDAEGQFWRVQCKTYLIPANLAIGNTMRLRLAPAKNNQEKGVKWAKEYEL